MKASAPGTPPALLLEHVSKTFGTQRVLDAVGLDIGVGEVHSVVGHNGSGKSTLVKILSGFHQPDPGGRLCVAGVATRLGDHGAAHRAGIRFVHQDLGLVRGLGTVDNLALGAGYVRRRGGAINWRSARRRATSLLHSLGYDFDVDVPVGALSAGRRTAVALARALQDGEAATRVLVLDEPTATMPASEYRDLFAVIGRLRATGIGVLYISHHLEEVLELGGRVTVLRNGEVVATAEAADLDEDRLVTLMIGRSVTSVAREAAPAAPDGAPGRALRVRALTTASLHGVDLDAGPGEVVGIAGLDGSGREDLLGAIAGVVPRRGEVLVGDVAVAPTRPTAAVRAGIGTVLADRAATGLFPRMSAGWNLTATGVACYVRRGRLSAAAERADAASWMRRLEVTPPVPDLPVMAFSGGNQQKIVLGRWLRRAPAVLLLEEPTQGVDVGAQEAIHRLVREAAGASAVVVSSTDAEELAAVADRVLVLRAGRVVADLSGRALTATQIEICTLSEEEVA